MGLLLKPIRFCLNKTGPPSSSLTASAITAITGHNNHFLWGPQGATGEVMLVYSNAFGIGRLSALFEQVTQVGRFEHPHAMPGQNNRTLYLCRGLRKPIEKFWRSIKAFG